MIYTYFFYFKAKVGDGLAEFNKVLHLNKEITSQVGIKKVEDYMKQLNPKYESVIVVNLKLLHIDAGELEGDEIGEHNQ